MKYRLIVRSEAEEDLSEGFVWWRGTGHWGTARVGRRGVLHQGGNVDLPMVTNVKSTRSRELVELERQLFHTTPVLAMGGLSNSS